MTSAAPRAVTRGATARPFGTQPPFFKDSPLSHSPIALSPAAYQRALKTSGTWATVDGLAGWTDRDEAGDARPLGFAVHSRCENRITLSAAAPSRHRECKHCRCDVWTSDHRTHFMCRRYRLLRAGICRWRGPHPPGSSVPAMARVVVFRALRGPAMCPREGCRLVYGARAASPGTVIIT